MTGPAILALLMKQGKKFSVKRTNRWTKYHPHKMPCFSTLIGHCIKQEYGQPAYKHSQQFLLQNNLVGLRCQVIGCQCGLLFQKFQEHVVSSLNVPAKELEQDASVSRPILAVQHSVHASAMLILTWAHSLLSLCYLKI